MINFKSAVNLLDKHNAHKLMRQSHSAEAQFKVCTLFNLIGQTERTAYNKIKIRTVHQKTLCLSGKLFACKFGTLDAQSNDAAVVFQL